ncbi:MAG: PAS domain-containing hybrid sensor histidine kinase/response regulator [Acidimicrobiia bacterium]
MDPMPDPGLPDVAELAPTGLAILAADGTILWANERLCRMLRRPASEVTGLRIAELAHPSERDLLRLDDDLATWTRFPPRVRLERPNGRFVWVGIWLRLVDHGDEARAIAHVADLSDLVDAEERLRTLVQGLDDGLVVIDSDGTVVSANPAAQQLFAGFVSELVGYDLHDTRDLAVVDERGRPLAHRPELDALATGDRQQALVGFRNSRGLERWVSMDAHPIDRGQGVRWVAVTYKDVSERRRIEAALELAEAADRAKGEFLSRMSHELRTPLNSVLGFAQLLDMSDLGAREREAVEQILIAGRHLLGLLDDVLDLERIDAGRLEVRVEPVGLRPAVKEAVELVQPLAATHGIDVQVQPTSERTIVLADEQRLRQVLLNLLTNAIKYNRPHGAVMVTTSGTADGVVVRIRDTGPGLRRDEIDRLFIPFERLDADRSGVEGAGVGLALAKRLTEAMGGRIGVESQPGAGSTFWCSFVPAPSPTPAVVTDLAAAVETAAPFTAVHRVLYIEDNSANRLLVEHIAALSGRIELVTAENATAGIDLARTLRPDAILLDLQLPDEPGEYVLRELHADSETRGIPVVIVSADASPARRARLLEAGAQAYLTKPLDVAAVFATLDEVLSTTA